MFKTISANESDGAQINVSAKRLLKGGRCRASMAFH